MKPLCIYHGNCADGFGAAWAVWKAHREDYDYHPGIHRDPPPDVTGRDVVIVDFSYRAPALADMAARAAGVTILDHHKTARDELMPMLDAGSIGGRFDMEKSGAMMAWEWFHPVTPPPPLLRHIEDGDLGRFALPGTREIQAALFSYAYDFETWDRLMAAPLEKLIEEGTAIDRKHTRDVDHLLGVVTRRMRIGGYEVRVANLPYTLTSDAGHILAKDAPFAACYWDTPSGRVFGLRSTDDGVDVSEIAKLYGGGGHRNASGFRVSFDEARDFEIPG